ncbi:MAG: RsmE family RNA methyltransferase [Candidatus Omnitrophota bacterium]
MEEERKGNTLNSPISFSLTLINMHRIYIKDTDLTSDRISIIDFDEIHHFCHVLHGKTNDKIMVFNNNGEEAQGRILEIKKDNILVEILSRQPSHDEADKTYLILGCAIPKKTKFEWIIEKSTELGVDEIIPLNTERTEFRYSQERADKKSQRYRTVAINAGKQSRRRKLPCIREITPFKQALSLIDENTLALIPCLSGKRQPLFGSIKNNSKKKIFILIGPEGDFSDEEIRMAIEKKAVPISLGETVLKVETAAIAVLSFLHLYCEAEKS